MTKTMSLKDFKKYCDELQSNIKFKDIFEIKCKKCGSTHIEVFGEYDDSGCYYPGDVGETMLVVKCHNCGNAKGWKWYSDVSEILN